MNIQSLLNNTQDTEKKRTRVERKAEIVKNMKFLEAGGKKAKMRKLEVADLERQFMMTLLLFVIILILYIEVR